MQFLSIVDAYKIQKRLWQNSSDIVAWKLGGTNSFTRDLFSVKEPYFGFLTAACLVQSGMKPTNHLNNFELEFCFKIPESYNPEKDYSLNNIMEWKRYFCLEFPYSAIDDLPSKGVSHLIADNCAAGALFISPIEIPKPYLSKYEMFICNDKVLDGLDLNEDLYINIKQFLELSKVHAFDVKGGQYIASGAISNIYQLSNGDTTEVYVGKKLLLSYVH